MNWGAGAAAVVNHAGLAHGPAARPHRSGSCAEGLDRPSGRKRRPACASLLPQRCDALEPGVLGLAGVLTARLRPLDAVDERVEVRLDAPWRTAAGAPLLDGALERGGRNADRLEAEEPGGSGELVRNGADLIQCERRPRAVANPRTQLEQRQRAAPQTLEIGVPLGCDRLVPRAGQPRATLDHAGSLVTDAVRRAPTLPRVRASRRIGKCRHRPKIM